MMGMSDFSYSAHGRQTVNIDMLTYQLSSNLTLTIHDAWQQMENVNSMFVSFNLQQPPTIVASGAPSEIEHFMF